MNYRAFLFDYCLTQKVDLEGAKDDLFRTFSFAKKDNLVMPTLAPNVVDYVIAKFKDEKFAAKLLVCQDKLLLIFSFKRVTVSEEGHVQSSFHDEAGLDAARTYVVPPFVECL